MSGNEADSEGEREGGREGGREGVPGQVLEVLHQVFLLHLEQLLVLAVHERVVPEGAHVHTQHFGRLHHL